MWGHDLESLRTMIARWPGTCRGCGLSYSSGSVIRRDVHGKWGHAECTGKVQARSAQRLDIFTDGSCPVSNPGPGGWAWWAGLDTWDSGSVPEATSPRMEILAVTEALLSLTGNTNLTIWSDSEYVVAGTTKWSKGWRRNGWRTAAGHPVQNRDLWEPLLDLVDEVQPELRWLKGHEGCPGNEYVDRLAYRSAHAGLAQAATGCGR